MNMNFEKIFACFLNLYVVPLVSLWFYAVLERKELCASLRSACRYAMYAAANFIFAHALALLFGVVLGRKIHATGSKYTVLAVLAALGIPLLEKFLREYASFVARRRSSRSEGVEGAEK